MIYLFGECSILKSLPDISKWNTNKVINMEGIFRGCSLLRALPDISKWKTDNIYNLEGIFNDCFS